MSRPDELLLALDACDDPVEFGRLLRSAFDDAGQVIEAARVSSRRETPMREVHMHQSTRTVALARIEARAVELKRADIKLTEAGAFAKALDEPEGKANYREHVVELQARVPEAPVTTANESRAMALARETGDDGRIKTQAAIDEATEAVLSRVAPGAMTREAAMDLATRLKPELLRDYNAASAAAQAKAEAQRAESSRQTIAHELARRERERGNW